MSKSAQAFRTIREVADWLGVAAHVLRFWESKFHQIKPVKRAGGRRYYRPADMALVGGIKVLLHDRGLTIRGVQKMIADEGIDAIAELSPPIDDLSNDADVIELAPGDAWDADAEAEQAATSPSDAPDKPQEAAPATELANADGASEAATASAPDTPAAAPEPGAESTPLAEVATEAATESAEETEAEPADDQAKATPADLLPEETTVPDTEAAAAETGKAPEPVAAAAATRRVALPASNPMEGPLGTLAALASLAPDARAAYAPQISALARLQARMSTPPDQP